MNTDRRGFLGALLAAPLLARLLPGFAAYQRSQEAARAAYADAFDAAFRRYRAIYSTAPIRTPYDGYREALESQTRIEIARLRAAGRFVREY